MYNMSLYVDLSAHDNDVKFS